MDYRLDAILEREYDYPPNSETAGSAPPQPAAPSPSDDDCIPWPYEWAWIIPSF
jgi:hypothetical protein